MEINLLPKLDYCNPNPNPNTNTLTQTSCSNPKCKRFVAVEPSVPEIDRCFLDERCVSAVDLNERIEETRDSDVLLTSLLL